MRGIVILSALVGCHDPGDGTAPESGTWTYIATKTPEDECKIAKTLGLDDGDYEVVNNGDGTLTIDDGTWDFDCTLSGTDFECPKRFRGGFTMMGIRLELDGEASGTFSTDESGEGEQSGTLSCGGDRACQTGAALMGMDTPCDVRVKFELVLER